MCDVKSKERGCTCAEYFCSCKKVLMAIIGRDSGIKELSKVLGICIDVFVEF